MAQWNRHCFSYLDWRLFLVYLLNAFTLILRTGRMGPVEKDHCLYDCPSQAASGGKSLSLQLSSGRLDGLCLPQPGTKEPSQASVRLSSTDGIGWSSAFCSHGFVLMPASKCCSLKVQYQQRCSLLRPHNSVSVHRSSSPQRSRVRRNSLLSLQGRVKDSRNQKRRCILSLSLANCSHGKTCITLSSPQRTSLA